MTYLAHTYPGVTVIGSYVTFGYQLCFSFLSGHKSNRVPQLLVGTCVHVGVAVGMGLFGFGLAICAAYCAFSNNDRSEALFVALNQGKDVLRDLITKRRAVNLPL